MAWVKLNDNSSESILCKQSDGENTYSSLSVGYYVNMLQFHGTRQTVKYYK